MSDNKQFSLNQRQYAGATAAPMAAPLPLKKSATLAILSKTSMCTTSNLTSTITSCTDVGDTRNQSMEPQTSVLNLQTQRLMQPPSTTQFNVFRVPTSPVSNVSNVEPNSQCQGLKVDNAMSYLDQVKHKFSNQPQVYNDFLHIMKEFKSQSIDTLDVIRRVSELFKGHPELIIGFNTYLPPVYKIEIDDIEQSSENMNQVIPNNIGNENLNVHEQFSPVTYNNAHVTAAQAQIVTQVVNQAQEGAPSTSQMQQDKPMDFNNAMNYLSKIKNRFQGQPDKYKRFLKILHTYQKERRAVKQSGYTGGSKSGSSSLPGSKKHFIETEFYRQVVELFENQEDLLLEFRRFLPKTKRQQKILTPTSSASTSNSTKVGTHQFRRLKVENALSYLDQVKLKFSDQPQVYNDFISIMKEYKSQSIDTPGVIIRALHLLKGYPELIIGFNAFLPPGYKIELQSNDEGYTVSIPSQPVLQSTSLLQPNHTVNIESPITACSISQSAKTHSIEQTSPGYKSIHHSIANHIVNQNLAVSEALSSPMMSYNNSHTITQPEAVNHPLNELHDGIPGTSQSLQNSGVNFNYATNYVNKIKSRFQDRPDKYKNFLEIIHTYQKEQRDIKDSSHISLTEAELYNQIGKLFENQKDLLLEFGQYLHEVMNEHNAAAHFESPATPAGIGGQSAATAATVAVPGLPKVSSQQSSALALSQHSASLFLKRLASPHRRTPIPDDPRHAALEDLYTCSLCSGYVIPEYRVCSKGHPICRGCVDTWGRCPLRCEPVRWESSPDGRRIPVYFSRYHRYETAVERVEFSCPYRDEGCPDKVRPGDYLSHAEECSYRPPPISPTTAARIDARHPSPIPVPASPPPGDLLHKQIRHEIYGSCPPSPSLVSPKTRLTKMLPPPVFTQPSQPSQQLQQ